MCSVSSMPYIKIRHEILYGAKAVKEWTEEYEIIGVRKEITLSKNNGTALKEGDLLQDEIESLREKSPSYVSLNDGGKEERIIRRVFVKTESSEAYGSLGWVMSQDILSCMSCEDLFTSFVWKHHCRSCGIMICNACSCYTAQVIEIEDEGLLRVCNRCSDHGVNQHVSITNYTSQQGVPFRDFGVAGKRKSITMPANSNTPRSSVDRSNSVDTSRSSVDTTPSSVTSPEQTNTKKTKKRGSVIGNLLHLHETKTPDSTPESNVKGKRGSLMGATLHTIATAFTHQGKIHHGQLTPQMFVLKPNHSLSKEESAKVKEIASSDVTVWTISEYSILLTETYLLIYSDTSKSRIYSHFWS